MAKLTIHRGQQTSFLEFTPPESLSVLLNRHNAALAQPCGRGVCGKCAVTLTGSVSQPNTAEIRLGTRLSCQAFITGDAEVTLPTMMPITQIACGQAAKLKANSPMKGPYGVAVDIGTTTIALLLYDLLTGHCVGSSSMLNPQTQIAADVIGRMDAALKGRGAELQTHVHNALTTLLASACSQAGVSPAQVESLVITGNTTMLYLLTGRSPLSLSRAPFAADYLFGSESAVLNRNAYLPHCLHAFVGADTSCAILASGMTQQMKTSLLCDVGTNGELALWHQGRLYIASTAAGPAFEGAGISYGCSSIPGAIDRVDAIDGELICHTINDMPAVGVCGSGLVDAIAAMLDTGTLDETGYLEDEICTLQDDVALTQGDIRAVQLAKSAIFAGIMTILSAAGCTADDIDTFYLAGGFGSHLNIRSAVRIGLIPSALADRVEVIGNAALDGASMLLLDTTRRAQISTLQKNAQHIRLDGNAEFADLYIEAMIFEAP